MRNATKTKERKTVSTNVEGSYHGYRDYNAPNVNYAFRGFDKNLYFTSDRTKVLDENFRLADNSPLKGYGLEIEVESSTITNSNTLAFTLREVAFKNLPEGLFKFQHDGSLGGASSTEAITQVMTKEFIRNNYPGFRYMYDIFAIYGVDAFRSGHCGMHCNMSVGMFGKTLAKQKEAIMKLVYFINHYFGVACSLLKRREANTGYCGVMDYVHQGNKSYNFTRMKDCQDFPLEESNENSSNHGVCFNYAHFNTGRVELRLVGGQKDYFMFRNTMETIFHLVEACKTCSWKEMDDLEKVFKGCNKYVLKRLEDLVTDGKMTSETFDRIKANSDTETDFGANL